MLQLLAGELHNSIDSPETLFLTPAVSMLPSLWSFTSHYTNIVGGHNAVGLGMMAQ